MSAWDYVGGTGAFFALSDLEVHFLTFLQRGVTARLYLRVVDEQIIAAIIGTDKSETLFFVKPFYCTCTHFYSFGL